MGDLSMYLKPVQRLNMHFRCTYTVVRLHLLAARRGCEWVNAACVMHVKWSKMTVI